MSGMTLNLDARHAFMQQDPACWCDICESKRLAIIKARSNAVNGENSLEPWREPAPEPSLEVPNGLRGMLYVPCCQVCGSPEDLVEGYCKLCFSYDLAYAREEINKQISQLVKDVSLLADRWLTLRGRVGR